MHAGWFTPTVHQLIYTIFIAGPIFQNEENIASINII